MATHTIPYSGEQIDAAIGTGLGQGYGTCGTAAATTAKEANLNGYVLTKGGIVAIKFTNSVPANATLSINSQTAKSIYYRGSPITADVIDAGDTVAFMYDGSYYRYLCKDTADGGSGNFGYVWQDGNGMVHISHEPTPMITLESLYVDGAGTYAAESGYAYTPVFVSAGTVGTPTASKSSVVNNSITVTPSVTSSAGWVTSGTKTGTGVTVSASEVATGTIYIDDAGNWDVTNAATAVVSEGTAGTPTASKGSVSNHSVAVTPSVTNVGGFISSGTKTGTAVTVSASELVSGTKSITENGTGIDVTNYASVNVSVSGGGTANLQDKTKSYTPTESAQSETVTADSGYDGLGSVAISVGAISSSYVGSGVARKSSTDLTVSGATVTAPAGYYASNASKSVASGSASPAASISGTSATVSTGTNTITLSKTVSNTPQVSAGYVASGTSGNSSVSLTASVTTKGATTYNTSSSDQTIASGTYLTGTQTIKAVKVTGLAADKILSGTTVKVGDANDDDRITSVSGSVTFVTYYTGTSAPSSSLGSNGDIYLKTS